MRRTGFRGKARDSAAYSFQLVVSGKDLPLATHIPEGQEEILTMHRLATFKGVIAIDMLSREIGPDKFAKMLKDFFHQHAGESVSWQTFEAAIEAGARKEIHWFFEQWFERTGAPGFELSWQRCGEKICGAITQSPPIYRAILEIEFCGVGHSDTQQAEVTGTRTKFEFEVPFPVEHVVLDPHYKVLRWTPDFHAPPQDQHQYGKELLAKS